ncbi:MAG: hypothetical protein GY754_38115 [bacterium]|nr:hypothetical protein [bacterium]
MKNITGKKFNGFILFLCGLLLFGCGSDSTSSDAPLGPEPTAPLNLTAADGTNDDRVLLSWDAVEGALYYKVYKATADPISDYYPVRTSKGEIIEVAENSYEDTTMSLNRHYLYKVAAVNEVGESELSDADEGWSQAQAPGAPANLLASDDGSESVTVSWDAADGALSYRVYRSDAIDGAYSLIADPVSGITYEDSTVTVEQTYYYKVMAVNDGGESGFSNVDDGYAYPLPPGIPSSLLASDGTYGNKVVISWNAAASAASYTVYRSDSVDGIYTLLAGDVAETRYEDFSVDVETTYVPYYYKVSSVNSGGESELSAPDEGYALEGEPEPPAAPENAAASDGSQDTVSITWSSVADADSYKVYRAGSVNGTYAEIAALSETTYVDSTVEPDVHYFYAVTAIKGAEESAYSTSDEGYAVPEVPPVVTNVLASDGTFGNKVALSWDAAVRAVTYKIYRADAIDGAYTETGTSAGTAYDDAAATAGSVYYYKVAAVNGGGESALSDADSGFAQAGTLEAPANVLASEDVIGSITVSWDTVIDADSYNIYRTDVLNGTYAVVATGIADLFYNDSDIDVSYIYYYKVSALNGDGEGALSSSDEGYGLPEPPPVVASLSATDGNYFDRVAITWSPADRADSYTVYRADTVDGTYAELAAGVTAVSYNDSTATVAQHYFYKVTAANEGGESDLAGTTADEGWSSVEPCTPPGIPANLASTSSSSEASIVIGWDAVSGSGITYNIYRSGTSGGTYSQVDNNVSATSYTDSNVSVDSFYYKVTAVEAECESDQSSSAGFTCHEEDVGCDKVIFCEPN